VRVSLKAVVGVDAVDVSLEKGLAVVKLKPGNTVTLKQLQEAIIKNGFTMKQSTATIAGQFVLEAGKPLIKISGSNDVLTLIPDSQGAPDARALSGKAVLVQGTIPEQLKGKLPDSIRYHSLVEEQK
jgi:copper chaperone CopZ